MARRLRIEYEGAIHHVTVRGNERRALFRDGADHQRFVEDLSRAVEGHQVRLHLYCLMGNHFHLLVETPHANLSEFMGGLLTAYTVFFNRRHRRHGHVTQGRYGARLVEGDEYLLRLSRYIHLNPVRTREMKKKPWKQRIKALEKYRWSSYAGYVSRSKAEEFMSYGPVLTQVGMGRQRTRLAYRRYVQAGLAEGDKEMEEILGRAEVAVGSEHFITWAKAQYEKLRENSEVAQEDIAFRRHLNKVPRDKVLDEVARVFETTVERIRRRTRGKPERAIAARLLREYGGLTQRETAKELGLGTGAAVSAQLKRLREVLSINKTLCTQFETLQKRLGRIRDGH